MTIIIPAIAAFLGIILGSFVNVLIFRLPRKEEVALTPSHCPSCQAKLKWFHNIPIASYIILHGKCAFCKNRISPQYPLVELANGLLWLLIFCLAPEPLSFPPLLYALAATVLLAISVIDAKTMTIPDSLNVTLLVIGILINIAVFEWQFTQSALLAFFGLGGFFYLVSAITGGGIGGGDIKLVAVIGLIIGLGGTLIGVLIGMLTFSLVGIILRKRKMAFGPHLSVGFVTAMLYGTQIIEWYLSLFIQ